MRSACIIGLVCLVPAVAHAAPEGSSTSSPKHELLERRVFLPSLLGFGAGTPPLVIGSSAVGFSTFPTGIVSYVGGEASSGAESSHFDSFAFNPSIDVRAGRFTIGGGLSVAYSHSVFAGAEGTVTSFELAPRVGYLIPLGGELYLWPRVSAGFLYGQAAAARAPTTAVTGVLASADVLLVAGLGSHFFLTVGPSGWIDAAWEPGMSSSSFGVGASVGLGVAL